MSNDPFAAGLSKLESDYQVLTELHRTADSRTFLARHLQLNRDVTISVIRGVRKALTRFDADVTRLKSLRHPNVIPVIEGRWLADDLFAVVRARVRGSTLDQLVTAVGPVPVARVAGTIEQVCSALDWARTSEIASRYIAEDAMIFQQGSGRVLLSLDPSPSPADTSYEVAMDASTDARTIGRLAWEMLSGHEYADAPAASLAQLRPDLPRTVVAETDALMRCATGTRCDAAAYVALLRRAVPFIEPATGMAGSFTDLDATSDSSANGSSGRGIRRWSVKKRFAAATAATVVLVLTAMLVLHRRGETAVDPAPSAQDSAAGEAGGEVALRARRGDTSRFSARRAALARQSTDPLSMLPQRVATRPTLDMRATPNYPVPAPLMAAPETLRYETPRREQMLSSPAISQSEQPADSTSRDVCDSPDASDQRRCLASAIDRNDGELNAVYGQVVAGLRRQANVGVDGPDPVTVDRLRSAQRNWLDARDQVCHTVGTGRLYARDRARCFADLATRRMRDLQRTLDSIPGGAPSQIRYNAPSAPNLTTRAQASTL